MPKIKLYDVIRKEWREFEVFPDDYSFTPKCENGLHQFSSRERRCSCGIVDRGI